MGKEKKQNLMQGAAILLFSMIIVKIVGAIFKLPLGNILMQMAGAGEISSVAEGREIIRNSFDIREL